MTGGYSGGGAGGVTTGGGGIGTTDVGAVGRSLPPHATQNASTAKSVSRRRAVKTRLPRPATDLTIRGTLLTSESKTQRRTFNEQAMKNESLVKDPEI
jgi:hypothetical protein